MCSAQGWEGLGPTLERRGEFQGSGKLGTFRGCWEGPSAARTPAVCRTPTSSVSLASHAVLGGRVFYGEGSGTSQGTCPRSLHRPCLAFLHTTGRCDAPHCSGQCPGRAESPLPTDQKPWAPLCSSSCTGTRASPAPPPRPPPGKLVPLVVQSRTVRPGNSDCWWGAFRVRN